MAVSLSDIRISIVVLNYRTPDQTGAALRSAREAAGDAQVEALVVDNSPGNESSLALERECPGARVLSMESNVGFAAGMNAGIRASSGDYILLLNSDVIAKTGSVSSLVAYMDGHADVGLCAPLLVDENGAPSRTLLLQPTVARVLLPWVGKSHYRAWRNKLGAEPLDVEATEGAAIMVRRSALEQAGLVDEDFFFYHEIVEWCMRIQDHGWKCVVLPSVQMIHTSGGSTGGMRRAARIELKRSEYQLLRKRLGGAMCVATQARDVISETLNVCFYGALILLSLRRWRRGLDKLRAHSAVWLWLLLGMPHRSDARYKRYFGQWD